MQVRRPRATLGLPQRRNVASVGVGRRIDQNDRALLDPRPLVDRGVRRADHLPDVGRRAHAHRQKRGTEHEVKRHQTHGDHTGQSPELAREPAGKQPPHQPHATHAHEHQQPIVGELGAHGHRGEQHPESPEARRGVGLPQIAHGDGKQQQNHTHRA